MLTTQLKIAEQISLRIRQQTSDAAIDEREIMLSVHQKLGAIVRNRLYESKGTESQEVDGSFYYPIEGLKVLKKAKNKYYIKMPSTSISLPFGVDIKRVGTDDGVGFVPVPNGFSDLYAGLASASLEGQIGYYKSGVNLMFSNMNSTNNPKTVNIEMALPFGSLDEDDEISIPADILAEVVESVFTDFVRTLQLPSDEVNNGVGS
tara:strand:- start:2081 stop:2695 length:615 start_codon:yes stop_codon:yes gene_type:complete